MAIKFSTLDYACGAQVFEAVVARPKDARASGRPCVLVLHDWSGVTEGMRGAAERVAKLGYVAFAADMYRKGIRGSATEDNSHLMNPLLDDRARLRRQLLASFETARRLPGVDAKRIAAIGFCFGGLCALDLARAAPPDLRGVVSLHGAYKPPDLGPQAEIGSSILILHGWEDPFTPPADVEALARELTDAGADWQLHAYGHAMHAFTFKGASAPEKGIAYNAAAARRAARTMADFLVDVLA